MCPASAAQKATLFLLSFVLGPPMPPTSPQGAAQTIGSAPSCPRCDIVLEKVATIPVSDLVDTEDSATLRGKSLLFAEDSKGRIFAAAVGGTSIKIIDKLRQATMTIPSATNGTGLFQWITQLQLTSGDSLFVSDKYGERHSLYAPDGSPVRTRRSPITPINEERVLSDGSVVGLAAVFRPKSTFGMPLHLISRVGSYVISFGSSSRTFRIDHRAEYLRYLAPSKPVAGAQSIWVARPYDYVVEKWSVDGRRIKTLVRTADWLRPWPNWYHRRWSKWETRITTVALPALTGIAVLQNGIIASLVIVPDSSQPSQGDEPAAGVVPSTIVAAASVHSVVEVLDPETARVVKRRTFAGELRGPPATTSSTK
jgi:hypothetical protein